jgi:hypothetical protein
MSPQNKPPYHKYPAAEPPVEEKYLPSFFAEVSFDKQNFKAEIRPLKKDVGYYTVSLDKIFIGHIHKSGEKWVDFIGGDTEIYQIIGERIEEHEKSGL